MNFEDQVLDALQGVCQGVHKLGVGDAQTHMGAIEVLALEVRSGSQGVAEALADVAAAIREATTDDTEEDTQ